jgi:hypothetical protein
VKLYHSKVDARSTAATSAQTGYPAANVALESITRNWRSVDATANDVTVTFNAAGVLAALLLTDVNFASCTVLKSADGIAYSVVGTLTTFADKLTGRRRGLIEINDPTVKAYRITIASGTPTDGLTYWRIGSAYPFSLSSVQPRNADYGARVHAIFPKLSTELPNKQVAQAITGPDILELSFPFDRSASEDVLELLRRGRAGTVGVAAEVTNYPEFLCPMRYVDEEQEEVLDTYNRSKLSIRMREAT